MTLRPLKCLLHTLMVHTLGSSLSSCASQRPHCRACDGYMMLNIDLFINTILAEEGIFKCSILN
jgi:hypothetical protein